MEQATDTTRGWLALLGGVSSLWRDGGRGPGLLRRRLRAGVHPVGLGSNDYPRHSRVSEGDVRPRVGDLPSTATGTAADAELERIRTSRRSTSAAGCRIIFCRRSSTRRPPRLWRATRGGGVVGPSRRRQAAASSPQHLQGGPDPGFGWLPDGVGSRTSIRPRPPAAQMLWRGRG